VGGGGNGLISTVSMKCWGNGLGRYILLLVVEYDGVVVFVVMWFDYLFD
jgi:hypothetical protein